MNYLLFPFQATLAVLVTCFGIREVLRHGRLENPGYGLSLGAYLSKNIAGRSSTPRWFTIAIKGAVPDLLIPMLVGAFAAFLGHVGLASACLTWSGIGKLVDQLSTHAVPTFIRRRRGLEPTDSPGLENWLWYVGLGAAEIALIYLVGGRIVWSLALISGGIFILLWVLVFGLWATNALRVRRHAIP